jgi:enediyne biosynthesis protein E4
MKNLFIILVACCALWRCNTPTAQQESVSSSAIQMTLLPAETTGIDFANMVPYNDTFNCYTFRNFYNGGGVGLGDINNDGLLDVFFCGNMTPNRLYLNLGAWKFKDITESCGMGLSKTWTAGVAFADVNGDGWLDIYTCKSGPLGGENRHNELFINAGGNENGAWKNSFSEQSKAWKLDNSGLSTHAAFFDYDRDGDLDCYLLNNSVRSVGGYDYRPGQRNTPDPQGGNKFLRNDGLSFTDITQQAGIYSSAIGFGLGVTVGDYDKDGWQDLFVSNDFFERDYLYHNKGDGTFEEVLESKMPEISKGSMGADMADLNNDGYPEIFVTEMTPPDDARYKTKAAFDDWNTFAMMQQTGYHRQFGRNVLQLNNAGQNFSEIGRMAGVHFTDWSWGALIADFDNDGLKDIFIANGIGKDLLDQDYTNFYADPAAVRNILKNNPGHGIKTLIDKMPGNAIVNFMLRQTGGEIPQFENIAAAAGMGQPSFSNGSAYGDLDNDGDLDLLVNNVNMPCFIYRNEAQKNGNNWLKFQVHGTGSNVFGLGTKISIQSNGKTYYQEIAPMRGFESCVDDRPNFGLGKDSVVQTVEITYPSGKIQILHDVSVNQVIQLNEQGETYAPKATQRPLLLPSPIPNIIFQERNYSDFDQEPLLFTMYSAEGPKMAVADVNGDGLEDVFIGAPAGQTPQLLLQGKGGVFKQIPQPDFAKDAACEDSAAAFFDADGDGDQDLYVGSGSNELQPGESALQDRLYINDGKGKFVRKPDALLTGKPFSTGCIAPADIDGDGDLDIFVGMRMIPGHYAQAPVSLILKNDGKGTFTPAMQQYPELGKIGMVTDAAWADMDGDNDLDLVTVGEWEPVRIFSNEKGKLTLLENFVQNRTENTNGWWNTLHIADINGDKKPDLIIGNHGLNSRFKASGLEPITLFSSDFDGNTRNETILCQYNNGQSYLVPLRNDMVKQIPILKKKYLQYANYKEQDIEQVFSPEQIKKAVKKEVTTLKSAILLNLGGMKMAWSDMPQQAQISPIYAIASGDFNHDGAIDLILGGNHERCKPETGIYLASRGTVMLGDGKGGFKPIPSSQSGIDIGGCVRGIAVLNNQILVTRNGNPLLKYTYNNNINSR